ncbi:MAG: hypothetical protein ACRBG0_26930 [Lewinella sp.]|uniref:hypothetical protein n=1 Tax=Lewinella sp. TaxID=2004506 RepID=UPI003D6AD0D9
MATEKAKKAPTNSQQLWNAFIKNVDTELSNIYTQKVTAVKSETKEMGAFIKSEDTLFTKAVELGGPLPYHKLPNWEEILSANPQHPGRFYKIIFRTLSEPDGTGEINKVNDASLIQVLHDAFQQSYTALSPKPNSEEAFVDWIGSTIINLEDAISISLQLALLTGKNGLNTAVFAAEDLDDKKGTWSYFEKAASGKSGKPTGIWPSHFLPAIQEILNDKGKEERDIERDTLRVINKLRATESSYNPSTEAAARSWVEGSITGMKTDNVLDNERKEELIANLEDEITYLFPQPDKSYFYNNFQGIIFQNIFAPPAADKKMESLLADIAEQEEKIKAANAKINKDEKELDSGKTDAKEDQGDGKGGIGPAKPPNKPKHPSLTGVKDILDDWFEKNDPSVDKKVKKDLEKSISNAIQSALTYSFDNLIEQGSQGALISATYNRQTITRVVDYLSNLLNDLNNDLDKEIPANKKASLDAAKSITSAAVAYRQFAEGLLEMQGAFNGEPVRNTANFQTVAGYMNSANPSTNEATSIPDIAQLIYNGIGKPEPQVKVAEAKGVQVAAFSAGLQTSLQRLLQTEQKAALAALTSLDNNALSDFNARLKSFDTDVADYFTSLTAYIQDRQGFEMDHQNSELIQQAMDNLTNIASNYSASA